MTNRVRPSGYIWTFVAMEYYALILNRIYLVFVCDRVISGACTGGPVASPIAPGPEWDNAYAYVREHLVRRYDGIDVSGPAFRRRHLFNFQLPRQDLRAVTLLRTPKWGMGAVPYSGRLILEWTSHRTRELILIGNQDGAGIRDRLLPFAAPARVVTPPAKTWVPAWAPDPWPEPI